MSPERSPAADAESFDLRSAAAALPGHGRFTDEQIEGIYAVGHRFFLQGNHRKALSFLTLTALYRPAEPRYQTALGLCHRALKNHARAMQAFSMVSMLEPASPEPGLHIAECLIATGRTDESRNLLQAVVEAAHRGGSGYERVRVRAMALLELLGQP
jgi:type III secretion system low calcium response chaperone LcrH/SycD